MRSPRVALVVVTFAGALTACVEGGTGPAPSLAPTEASLAKPSAPADPTATFFFSPDASLGLRSDGKFLANSPLDGAGAPIYSSQPSSYADGVCGVGTRIFTLGSGDATLNLANPRNKDRSCSGGRSYIIDFGDGSGPTTSGTFMNAREIANATYQIPVGTTALRHLLLDDPRCDGLRWRPTLADGTVTGADEVLVTRISSDTWRVRTQPAPANKAYCLITGALYNISVDFVIKSSYPLP